MKKNNFRSHPVGSLGTAVLVFIVLWILKHTEILDLKWITIATAALGSGALSRLAILLLNPPEWFNRPDLLCPPYDIFVSYKSEDVEMARLLADQLIARSIKVWFAEYQVLLQNYDQFQRAIEDGILQSSYGIAFTNDRYAESKHCAHELELLLKHCGPQRVLEVRTRAETKTRRKFHGLAESPVFNFNGQIGPILSFIKRETGLSIDLKDEPINGCRSRHHYQLGVCMGRPYYLDTAGWHPEEGNLATLKLVDSEYPAFVNVYAGTELASEALRYHSDDRRMYENLMNYAPRHLKRLNAKLWGLHLFFYRGLSQMALTYWTKHSRLAGYWTRKYSIILPHPEGKGAAEFVCTFGFLGPFESYCRHVYKMERLVQSLEW